MAPDPAAPAGRRLDADDIGQVQSTDTGTEITVCPARIGQDDTGGKPLRMGFADLIERDLRLDFEPDILRHMRAASFVHVSGG